MCGIAGRLVFEKSSRLVDKSLLVKMCNEMVHRGPDGAGVWVSSDGQIGLGHRRLAIVDLSKSAEQPMFNRDGSLSLVFNGEIYNHAEIRRELEKIGGCHWKTDHSDSEVVLNAFEKWGIDCLGRFRGMFSIAIWDSRKRELWLIRDRLGEKPLYYSVIHDRITFASEIKALLQDPEQPRAVNPEALYHYLSFLTTPAPHTMFDGIRKLPAGHWLRVRQDGDIKEFCYWDVWEHTNPLLGMTEDDICERIIETLRDSVRLRKVSDVPVGVFLSGGVDSSTNTALFSEGEVHPVNTFSIGYQGELHSYQNELPYAREMAATVGANHYECLLNVNDLLDFLPKMIQLQDEPIADPVCFPVYFLSKLARESGVSVCQVGEGADELFCGYPHWKTMLNLQKLNDWPLPNSFKRIALAGLKLTGREQSFSYEWLRRGTSGLPVFWGGAEAFTEAQKNRLLNSDFRRNIAVDTSWDILSPIRKKFETLAWEPSNLNWMSYLDLKLRLPELLLMRVDKMSMGASLEARVPFLDHKFVELIMSIPTDMKLGNGSLKYLLKKSVRGLIPENIIDRKKQGFGVPIHEWFLGGLSQTIREELESFCSNTDYLNRQEVMRLIDSGNANQVWYLYNLALWWRTYIAQ